MSDEYYCNLGCFAEFVLTAFCFATVLTDSVHEVFCSDTL